MTIFTIITDVLFLCWLFLTAYIGYRILSSMQEQTTKLINILMTTVTQTAEAAKSSSEEAQRMVTLLEQRLHDDHQ